MKLNFDPREGLCAQIGGDFWFPDKGEQANDAKKGCFQCPIRIQCLDYAMEHTELEGVWGGLSRKQREKRRTEERKNAA